MLTGKIPYDGDSFSDVLQNNKKAEIDFSLPYLNKIDKTALDLLKHMLEIDVNKRYSAEECLEHPYFDKETVHSQTRRDSINLTDNVNLFKEKYKKPRESKFTDSIRFNVNPDVNGRTDTFNMVDDSPKTQNRMRIDSFHSKNILNSPKNSPKALPGMNSPKMSHNPIYRRALMGPAGKYVGENRSRDTSIDTSPKTNSGDDGSPVEGFSSRVSKFGQKN
jgi:serine/threonine-protein kinase CHEK2